MGVSLFYGAAGGTRMMGRRRLLTGIAAAAAVVDLGLLAVLHVVQPGVGVLTDPTSSYVHGTFGMAVPVAACAVGVGAVALTFAAWDVIDGRPGRVGVLLLAVFGLAKVLQAFFPIDVDGQSTGSGALHNLLGNVAFFVLPVAAGLITPALARALGRGAAGATVIGWALAALAVLVLVGDAAGFFGLAQRLYLVYASVWMLMVALWLRRVSR